MRCRPSALLLAALLFLAPFARAQTVLNVATGGAFTSLDPHYHRLSPNNIIADYLFGTLVRTGPDAHLAPGLALSWTTLDDHTWEFKLRPGVVFSDGAPFTADDVAFTFARIPTILNSPSSFNAAVKPAGRLEIVDPLTIRMHTNEPEPLLPLYLTAVRIVSRKHGEGAGTADYNSGKAAIGAGPYKLDSVQLGDRVVFVRNERYWGPKPDWDRVVYRLIANNAARTAALQAGDVDIIDQVSTRDVESLRRDPKLTLDASEPGERFIYINIDSGREQTPFATDLAGQALPRNPLKDVRVRKALSLAINREGIKTQIMDGFAAPTGQLLPPRGVGYTPDLKPDPYDPAAARKLLAAAGYPNGFGLTLHGTNDRYVNDRAILEAIAQMWTRIGVKTAVAAMPSSTFFSGAARDEYTISLAGWAALDANNSLIQILASSNPAKGRGAVFHPAHFGDPAIDAVIERSLATFDPEERERLYIEATKMGMAQQAILPLHHQIDIYAMKKGFVRQPRIDEGIYAWEVTAPQ